MRSRVREEREREERGGRTIGVKRERTEDREEGSRRKSQRKSATARDKCTLGKLLFRIKMQTGRVPPKKTHIFGTRKFGTFSVENVKIYRKFSTR